jgi:hypothetical protein
VQRGPAQNSLSSPDRSICFRIETTISAWPEQSRPIRTNMLMQSRTGTESNAIPRLRPKTSLGGPRRRRRRRRPLAVSDQPRRSSRMRPRPHRHNQDAERPSVSQIRRPIRRRQHLRAGASGRVVPPLAGTGAPGFEAIGGCGSRPGGQAEERDRQGARGAGQIVGSRTAAADLASGGLRDRRPRSEQQRARAARSAG